MKILLSFQQDYRVIAHPIPSYRFWAYYIKNGISETGMQWLEVPDADWAEGLTYADDSKEINQWRDKIWEATLNFIKKHRHEIDIFLTYLYPKQIEAAAIQEIKRLGIPCVNFYCDNVREFSDVPQQFRAFDLVWVPEYQALEMYRKAAVPYIHLPMPMWVEPRLRIPKEPDEHVQISFLGTKDALREKLLSEAIRLGLPVEIWGRGWRGDNETGKSEIKNSVATLISNQLAFIKTKGLKSYFIKHLQKMQMSGGKNQIDIRHLRNVPEFEEYTYISRNSKITLGINQVPTFKRLNPNPLKYSRLRDIEAPMLGACYLTEYCAGVEILFEPGRDIEVYNSPNELVDCAKELLASKVRRDQLRFNGQQKALNELSIPASLRKLEIAIFK